ncbi:MAG: GYD domain-containing protein [archaeon]|nr:GYD domain-containing protein [archaeon]MCP8320150.1 GYD domain-containing protein [archaeon]
MLFVTLVRMRQKITKETEERASQFMKKPPPGIKIHNVLYTLGRFDAVIFYEAPSEKEAMVTSLMWADIAATETLVAIPREEAIKLLKS